MADDGPGYDEEFFASLEAVALPYLRDREFVVVADTPERYNVVARLALKYELRYDWQPPSGVVVLHALDGGERVAYSPPG